jgi:hypothetical protein
MARRSSIGSTFERPAAPKQGFLEKLEQLRSFVGLSVGEDDLNNCLKLCGCDVNLAATKLITGEFNRREAGTKRGSTAFFDLTKNSSPERVKKPRNSIPLETKSTPKHAAKPAQKPTPKACLYSAPTPVTPDTSRKGYLLCQRWSTAESRSKDGRVLYQEALQVTCSTSGPPMVRLSGTRVESVLPRNLCTMLAPLMTKGLLHLTAESLLEDKRLFIGAQLPISLR